MKNANWYANEIQNIVNDMAMYIDTDPQEQDFHFSRLTLQLPAKLAEKAREMVRAKLGLWV